MADRLRYAFPEESKRTCPSIVILSTQALRLAIRAVSIGEL